MKRLCALFLSLCLGAPAYAGDPGVEAFEQHRWKEALGNFLAALRLDPTNSMAHAYITLIAREMETEWRAAAQEARLRMLSAASKRLEDNRMDSAPLQNAISDTTQADRRAREERWRSRCEEARIERDLGHLPAANDLILKVLSEEPGHAEAQRVLSELQSRLRAALDNAGGLSVPERYAYQGFYAYGQADYAEAFTAWQKVHSILEQGAPAAEAADKIAALHFTVYEKIAQAHVEEEKRTLSLRALFQEGQTLFQMGRYNKALQTFRQLAIQEPEFPQLGFYLVQAEAAAEKDRARRLGEHQRREVEQRLQRGVASLEQQKYPEAEKDFERVLALDPGHPQAASYLAMAQAEMKRNHDPQAAQMHYEAGLIDYASGKLEDAVREWRIATRMDPHHEKAVVALNKVQKELALNQEGGLP
jgi:tetratricopeptide (TPR) repeat protein